MIGNAIGVIITRREKVVMIVPRWEAKSWWPVLTERAEIEFFDGKHVKTVGGTAPRWSFVLAKFV